MCPACIESTAVVVAGAGSAAGVLAILVAKFRNVLIATVDLFHRPKEK
jgi:hypothetical protein